MHRLDNAKDELLVKPSYEDLEEAKNYLKPGVY